MPAAKSGPRRSRARTAGPQPRFPIAYVRYHDHCWLEAKELEKIQYDDVTIIMRSDILELRVSDASEGEGKGLGEGKGVGWGKREEDGD